MAMVGEVAAVRRAYVASAVARRASVAPTAPRGASMATTAPRRGHAAQAVRVMPGSAGGCTGVSTGALHGGEQSFRPVLVQVGALVSRGGPGVGSCELLPQAGHLAISRSSSRLLLRCTVAGQQGLDRSRGCGQQELVGTGLRRRAGLRCSRLREWWGSLGDVRDGGVGGSS